MTEINYSATAIKNRAQTIVATFHVAWERYDRIEDVKQLLTDAVDELVNQRANDPVFGRKRRADDLSALAASGGHSEFCGAGFSGSECDPGCVAVNP